MSHSDLSTLLNRIEGYASRTGAARSTISRKLFGNGRRLDEIQAGGTLTLRILQEADSKLSELERAA